MTLVAAARSLIRRGQSYVPRAKSGFAYLAYHLVGAGTGRVIDHDLARFRDDMEQVKSEASVCSLDEALEDSEDDRPRVVISFDDAYANFADVAWPVLDALEIPVLLYVPVGFIAGESPSPIRGCELPPASWSVLRDLAKHPLVSVGSHSNAHRDMRTLSDSELRDDLRSSRDTLEQQLQTEVVHFCYPQGKWSPAVEYAVGRYYETAAIGGGRRNDSNTNPLRLNRVPVRSDSGASIREMVTASIWLEEWLAGTVRRIR